MSVAVVTGSSSGIGRATALELAAKGHSMVLHARKNIEGLQTTAKEIRTHYGQESLCVTADISCPRMCCDLVRSAFAWKGGVEIWVNNAGADVLRPGIRDWPLEAKLELLLDVDVKGTVRLSRLVAQHMLNQDNRPPQTIINIGWDQAEVGMEGEPGQMFCTAKAAVQAFTRSLAKTYPIRALCVAPGWIKTSWGEESASDYWDRRAIGESLQNRWGRPEDVAQTIGWLTSREAEFVNGTVIEVNGGRRFWSEPNSDVRQKPRVKRELSDK